MDHTEPKLGSLVSRFRALPARPSQGELQDLYTDGCAELLRLEAELRRLKRRLIAAEADSDHDAVAAREAVRLRGDRDALLKQRGALRDVVRLLRTAVDWSDVSATPA
jgi:hypothetical protein